MKNPIKKEEVENDAFGINTSNNELGAINGNSKIKRGNSVDRNVEGELVYDTGSKEVFRGDGATQGGIAVSPQNLEDLHVPMDAQKDPNISIYNGSTAVSINSMDIRGNIYGDDPNTFS